MWPISLKNELWCNSHPRSGFCAEFCVVYTYVGLNPFGSDSDDGEESMGGSPPGGVMRRDSSALRRESPALRRESPALRRDSPALRRDSPLAHFQGGSSRNSPLQNCSLSLPNMGSDVVEFIEPPQEFDVTSDPGGRTALHLAIAYSHPEVVSVLLSHKGRKHSEYMLGILIRS